MSGDSLRSRVRDHRLTRTLLALALLALALVALRPATAAAAAPSVTLADPANGALILGSQPTFSGTAANRPAAAGIVTVSVYSSTAAVGVPTLVLTAPVVNGKYSVSPLAVRLPDGAYTVQASEPDAQGHVGVSDAHTFALSTAAPGITLGAPASEPVSTPAPTFTGTASTSPGAAGTVTLVVYPGATTDATPLETVTGPVDSTGGFSVQIAPGLANGQYTIVAAQAVAAGEAYSSPVTISVQGAAPALTVTAPAEGGSLAQSALNFSGSAGSAYGDADTVELTVYRGPSASGQPLDAWSAPVANGAWSTRYPGSQLALGTYTLVAVQSSLSGQATTIVRHFTVARPAYAALNTLHLAQGRLTIAVGCLPGVDMCSGDLLILSANPLQTQFGGPRGPLRLLFVHFAVTGGVRQQVGQTLSRAALRALRAGGREPLRVLISYRQGRSLLVASALTPTLTF